MHKRSIIFERKKKNLGIPFVWEYILFTDRTIEWWHQAKELFHLILARCFQFASKTDWDVDILNVEEYRIKNGFSVPKRIRQGKNVTLELSKEENDSGYMSDVEADKTEKEDSKRVKMEDTSLHKKFHPRYTNRPMS